MAGLTYISITGGFAYAALILDAWSRRVVGHAIGRGIDARLGVKALRQAIALRKPAEGSRVVATVSTISVSPILP